MFLNKFGMFLKFCFYEEYCFMIVGMFFVILWCKSYVVFLKEYGFVWFFFVFRSS